MSTLRDKAARELQRFDRLGIDPTQVLERTVRLAQDEIGSFAGCTDDQWLAWLFSIVERSVDDVDIRDAAGDDATVPVDQRHEPTPALSRCSSSVEDQEQSAESTQADDRLRAAIAHLPAVPAQVVRLRQFHKWTLARIAAHLGLEELVVAGLLRQSVRRLREAIEAEDSSES